MLDPFNLEFSRAWGAPPLRAQIKVVPEDFFVEEQLGFEPAGSGEHLYLFIEKRDHNTQTVAEHLAAMAHVRVSDVSYSGMKDRRAVTRQWFSVYLQQRDDFVWPLSPDSGITLLRCARHHKKLRRGEHAANFFRIHLRRLDGDRDALLARLAQIAGHGVPNYYGEQRFGHQGSNLRDIERFLARAKGKQQGFQDRLRVSALRSWLFNAVLDLRVQHQCWDRVVEGDPELYPSAPLWGRGRLASSLQVRAWEESIMKASADCCHFLEHCGLQQERRPCVLKPQHLQYQLEDDSVMLEFILPPGTYATSLIREIADLPHE